MIIDHHISNPQFPQSRDLTCSLALDQQRHPALSPPEGPSAPPPDVSTKNGVVGGAGDARFHLPTRTTLAHRLISDWLELEGDSK